MAGVSKITHKGKEILFVDYKGVTDEAEMISFLKEAQKIVINDNKPYLQLSDITGVFLTPEYMKKLKEIAKETPKIAIKRAVVGITPIKKIILNTYNLILGKNGLKAFSNLEDAKDWIVS